MVILLYGDKMKVSELTREYEFGDIVISGNAGNGHYYNNLSGVIGSVSKGHIKVWPKSDTGIDDGGKIWFDDTAIIHEITKDE